MSPSLRPVSICYERGSQLVRIEEPLLHQDGAQVLPARVEGGRGRPEKGRAVGLVLCLVPHGVIYRLSADGG